MTAALPTKARAEAIKAQLDAHIEQANAFAVQLLRADTIPLEPIRWLWKWYLPQGMLSVLAGLPGCGKTTIALDLMARVSRGRGWPDGSWGTTGCGDAVIWSGEDLPSVMRARLQAAGADLSRCHLVGDLSGQPFDPSRDIPFLEEAIAQLERPRLLVVDPIVSAISGDGNAANDVRKSMAPLVDLARRMDCAVLGITHFRKGSAGSDPVERVLGSQALPAAARMVLVAAKEQQIDPLIEPNRVFLRAKSNIGPDTGGFNYTLAREEVAKDVEGQTVLWGEKIDGTALQVLGEAETPQDDEGAPKSEAEKWLLEVLAHGDVPAKEIERDCKQLGVAYRTMQRIGDRIGVKRRKGSMKEGWIWSLPKASKDPEGDTKNREGAEDANTTGASAYLSPSEDDTRTRPPVALTPSAPSVCFLSPSTLDGAFTADDSEVI